MSFLLDDYDYALPPDLIAKTPVEPRDASRLLVLDRASGRIEHRRFLDLPSYLGPEDLMVANNTEVIRARLPGRRLLDENGATSESGKVEFLLLEELEPLVWEGMFHAAAKHRPGLRFLVPTPDGKGLRGELIRGASESESGTVVARFDREPLTSGAGEIPLPHYLGRDAEEADETRYQTVYAAEPGSAAAPTAGLHFTTRVIEELRSKGVGWEAVTLHVGLGTFRPVRSGDIREHVMHEERYSIDPVVAERLNQAKKSGRRIVAVGTTSVRTLEGAWQEESGIRSGMGRTRLFLYPGHGSFHIVDRMLTNFHLPKSTLLMLVSAFAGRELALKAYREAVEEKYRFFSYGDAMLIL